MSNHSTVKCPKCGNEFEATESIKLELQEKLKKEAAEWKQKKENEYQQQLQDTLDKQKKAVEDNIRKTMSMDFENKMKLLQESNDEFESKLRKSQEKELEFLKKMQELKNKEAELDLQMQKKLNTEREGLVQQIQKQEQEKVLLEIEKYKKQLEDQNRLVEEMKKKAEQGSMQMQGEVQELALEEMLRSTFPFDKVEEVAKGQRGADCILHVKNTLGQACGKIIFESKRTKSFGGDWIEKLKTDMRAQQAEIAVLVTEVLPRDMDTFGQKEGVYICRFQEAKALTIVLREALIKLQGAIISQENKADKMSTLYNYMTGVEFRQNIEAVIEGFLSLKDGINKERIAMEKIWKEREKQLEKVLTNTAQFYGSVKGIAGNALGDIKLLE